MYIYETHLHSVGCSACGKSTAVEMVDAAKERGYSGVIFTNHFYHGNTAIDRSLAWSEFVEAYNQDYLTAKAYGEKAGIDVLFGLEEVYEPGKEALIYGLEPEIIKNAPELLRTNIKYLSDFVRNNGGFIVCAHPFRQRAYIPDPLKEPDMNCFDAVEVNNYHNTDEDNERAKLFAEENNLQVIAGGDIHETKYFGHSGLAFYERITDNKKLVTALKNNSYKLYIRDEIV